MIVSAFQERKINKPDERRKLADGRIHTRSIDKPLLPPLDVKFGANTNEFRDDICAPDERIVALLSGKNEFVAL